MPKEENEEEDKDHPGASMTVKEEAPEKAPTPPSPAFPNSPPIPNSLPPPPPPPSQQQQQVFGYSQKNYHIADGNLYSVLTPFQARPSTSRPCFVHRGERARGRRKTRWKLKFHHQALPPEYLDHYESTLAKSDSSAAAHPSCSAAAPPPAPPPPATRGRGRGRGRRVPLFLQDLGKAAPPPPPAPLLSQPPSQPQPPTQRVFPADLPYMGEMTLGTKPRRGRKPKKADICHLISKNYGVVVQPQPQALPQVPEEVKLQAREEPVTVPEPPEQLEPLNLCLRDLQEEVHVKVEPESDLEEESALPKESAESSLQEMSQPQSQPQFPTAMAGGYVYWPSARVFVHPVALQPPHLLYGSANSDKEEKQSGNLLWSHLTAPEASKKTATATATAPQPKRKRSAIFIPPAETPTEVSICKFKFTGGAKPSLEEKKMLSVDSGGNFRYYSGTGDKSMRGYEFFGAPGTSTGSSTVAPAAAPVPSTPATSTTTSASTTTRPKRRRRTRKSLVRERLEQTFKEKGFLIQTQQLQSAEGATYCKFRQLRKFTRYLFRSWKDYLPGNLQEMGGLGSSSEAGTAAGVEAAASSTQSEVGNATVVVKGSAGTL